MGKYFKEWVSKHRQNMRESSRRYYEKNKDKILEKSRKHHKEIRGKIRAEIFELLGNKCSNPNCLVPNGCRDVRCLQIDHVNGGGWKVRKHMNHTYYEKMVLEQLKAGSKDYQLLCANCNWIKKSEKNEVGSIKDCEDDKIAMP